MTGLRWGAVTDRGRVRRLNEDAFLADPPLFVVADGMGGHSAGDVASWLAVEAFAELVGAGPVTAERVSHAISEANRTILKHADANPGTAGMGTTITGLAVVHAAGRDHWMAFNVGDSRVYRLVEDTFEQLTVDHSEAEEMVLAGRITRDQARTYNRRNVVTRSLGTDPPPVFDSWVFPAVEGERFLVCSDGLTTEVTDEHIRQTLSANPDPETAARSLLASALEAGGRDNVTVVVVDGGPASKASEVDEDTWPRER